MAAAPQHSLPKQCGDWADIKAAYRFLNHPKVTPHKIQSTHRQRVRRACEDHPVILAVQDTTELDFTSRETVSGLGPIGDGRGAGLLQHSTLALSPSASATHAAPWQRQRRMVCFRPVMNSLVGRSLSFTTNPVTT